MLYVGNYRDIGYMNFFRDKRRIIVGIILLTFIFWTIVPILFALLRGMH